MPREPHNCALQELPVEVLLQLLDRLGVRDRLVLGQSCKRLQSVVDSPSSLWRRVKLEAPLELPTTQVKAQAFETWFLNKGTAVEHLVLNFTSQPTTPPNALEAYTSRVWPHIYGALLLCRHGLEKLELTWNGPLVLGPLVAKGFPSLRVVKVTADSLSLEPGLQHASALCSLTLTAPKATIASLPTALTNLTFGDCGLTALPAELSALRALEQLAVNNARLGASSFVALSALTELTWLSLFGGRLATLPAELSGLTRLKCLYLNSNPITLAEHLAVVSSLPELEVLAVPDCQLTGLPAALSVLGSLRKLFCHDNEIEAFAGASSLLSRVKVLSLGLADLCRCLDEVRLAQNLVTLYISRSGDPAEEQCAGLFEARSSLPCLESVLYVRPSSNRQMDDSFEFGQLLQRLWSKSGYDVQYIESSDIVWT